MGEVNLIVVSFTRMGYGVKLFMGGLGRVADWILSLKSTRRLKYLKVCPYLRAYFFVAIRPFS